ncbi:concanavalin A-like lectin/glucanase [Thozetella sp. PMI_491]|nr:concanavalin A-like lectin/glucanase [Thozetella sp. PMI_491]
MKWTAALVLLAAAAQQALAELTYTVTATHKGKPIDSSSIKLEPIDLRINPANLTANPGRVKPPVPKGSTRKSRRAIGTSTSSNWCGAAVQPSGTARISAVHGWFQCPTLSARSGVTSYPQWVGEWVGIDGLTNGVILQAGAGHQISSTGVQSNFAWFQWYPSSAYTITSFPVAAGDFIEVTINTTSTTSGVVTLTNGNQGYTYTVTLTGGTTLSRTSAEWILEDPASGGSLLPFASFSDVWFEDVYATTTSNTHLGVDSSTLISIDSGTCTAEEYDDGDFYTWSS